jgi:hypothetical protein
MGLSYSGLSRVSIPQVSVHLDCRDKPGNDKKVASSRTNERQFESCSAEELVRWPCFDHVDERDEQQAALSRLLYKMPANRSSNHDGTSL